MTRKNPGDCMAPQIVLQTAKAVEQKLGRPSYVRKVKNKEEWFITDPLFSFVQYASRKGATGYRIGYFFLAEVDELLFVLVHSPIMAQLFKKNIHLATIIHVAERVSRFCSDMRLSWDSRFALKHGERFSFIENSSDNFVSMLKQSDEKEFINDLFPRVENQGTGTGPAKWAGNTFYFLLAQNASHLNGDDISGIIETSWPLFLCLYPIEAIERRDASLARALQSSKILKKCEYTFIIGRPNETAVSSLCRGIIEGAHIKPHSLGGNDRQENGLWLCQYHHHATEGRLIGSRSAERIDVRFITK